MHFIIATLFCSGYIWLSSLKPVRSGICSRHLASDLMRIPFSVLLLNIDHRFFCEFRAEIYEAAKLADMVRDVVQEMHLHKVEIRLVNKILCNFGLDLHFIFINATRHCSCRKLVKNTFYWSYVFCFFMASKTFIVDLLARNRLKSSL